MAVVLVLLTFVVFIVIDAILSRNKAPKVARETQPAPEGAAWGNYVEGFLVPDQVRYHAGHGWLFRERKNVMRVGVDEFAAALLGSVDKIEVPKPGHWVRQGQKAFTFTKGGEKTEVLSPVEGEVVEVNSEVLSDPGLLRRDPYGKGWLMTVFAPDEESTLRNLLPKELVNGWIREAVERLYALQPQFAGATAADGGRPADDLLATVPGVAWKQITGEFFLTR